MQPSTLFFLPLLLSLALALPSSHLRRRTHEHLRARPKAWSAHARPPHPSTPVPLRIALTQSNLHLGYDELMRVSDPSSPDYGKHWTPQQVGDFFAPSNVTLHTVLAWLEAEGFPRDRVHVSPSRGWLSLVNCSLADAERLLSTTYALYTHSTDGTPQLACTDYSLPEHVAPHVDFITPTVHFDAKVRHTRSADHVRSFDRLRAALKRDDDPPTPHPPAAAALGMPWSASLPTVGEINLFNVFTELDNCAEQINPACLRAMYKIPPAGFQLATSKNSLGIVEFSPQAYLDADLDMFFQMFEPEAVGDRPVLEGIDGGYQQTQVQGFPYNAEADLDVEYAMALTSPLIPVVYQVGDPVLSGSFNNFLDAIDGSYCTYEGGDDPTEDSIYPDAEYPQGYQGTNQCGTLAPTYVISVSYSYDENGLTPFYEERQCNEYMKLGLQGSTLLFATGDRGVASAYGLCYDEASNTNIPTGTRFVPSFPGGCPYITAVGATQLPEGGNVLSQEIAVETQVFSGGGFSDVFALPSYQAAAVANYYANSPPPYTAAQYNNSQHSRGFPDIAANGANFVTAVDGNFTTMFGTSASTPVVASVITLINDVRLAFGKGPVGFINPALYANPGMLNDIVEGTNPGCGTDGFSAQQGWDPVTGLGTPNYPLMEAYFLGLP